MLKQYPWIGIAARNGCIGGFVGFAMLVGLYYMGRHPFLIPPYMDFRIVLFGVFLFFTLKEFRDYFQSGELYFWQGLFMSLVFTVVYSLVAFFLIWGFGLWKPAFISTYVAQMLDQVKAMPPQIIERIGKGDYDRTLAAIPGTKAFDLGYLYFWQSFGISFFVSVIISVILRRQPKT